MRRTKALAATGLVAALTLSACGAGGGSDDGDNTLNMHIGEVRSLVPGGSGESEGFRIIRNIYDGLYYYDANTGEPTPILAEDVQTEDNTTWTIKIVEGREFHNGEPVDAEAFIRNWNRVAYAPNALPLNYFMGTIEGYDAMNPDPLPEEEWADPETPEYGEVETKELSGLKAVDEYTLEVTLNRPFAGFSTMLGYEAFLPVAQECLDDVEACEKSPIGNGPFMVDGEYDVNNGGSLVAWDDYQGDKPNIDGVKYKTYLEGTDCWADFMTGDIDVCRPPAAKAEAAANDELLAERRIQQDDTSILYLGFPMYDEKFEDVKVRRAISKAIDREGVINVIDPDRANPFDSWVPSTIMGGGQGLCGEDCEYDPEGAKKLLDEAGGWPEGETFKIYVNDSNDNLDVFKAVGDSISNALGIEYETVPMQWPEFLAAREGHKLDGPFRGGWAPDYNMNENYLDPIYGGGAATNDFGYDSEEFTKALNDAGAADTMEDSIKEYVKAEEVLAEDMPAAPIWVEKVNYFYSERVDNVVVNPMYNGPGGDAELRIIEIK
ncbi:peptide ABC transporter substrate-binding protein [Salininema proteolyticum]|uniref:ABC transporter substrate-binding protein n=1 Tax=Salininema proteolyticum TaxID=1607685 RepID=A0ABV8TW42_9ACTN